MLTSPALTVNAEDRSIVSISSCSFSEQSRGGVNAGRRSAHNRVLAIDVRFKENVRLI